MAVKDKFLWWTYSHFLCDRRALGLSHRSQALSLGESNSQWLYPIASVVMNQRPPPPPSTAQTSLWIIGQTSVQTVIHTMGIYYRNRKLCSWCYICIYNHKNFLTNHVCIQLLCVNESYRQIMWLFTCKINFMFVRKWNK